MTDLRQAANEWVSRRLAAGKIIGYPGIKDASGNWVFPVTGTLGRVYVRVYSGLGGDEGSEAAIGQAIWRGTLVLNPNQAYELKRVGGEYAFEDEEVTSLAETYQGGAPVQSNTTVINISQMEPGRVHWDSEIPGLKLVVEPLTHKGGRLPRTVPDFSSIESGLSSGQKKFVVMYVDPAEASQADALKTSSSSALGLSYPFTYTDVKALISISSGTIPLAAVEVVEGTSAFSESTRIIDLREWLSAGMDTTPTSPLTTKGDLYTYSTANARLPVGTDSYVLSADSGETTGLKWVPNSSAGTRVSLYDNTLGSDGEWDVSSIDQGYDDLEIIIEAAGAAAVHNDTLYIFLNNDTTAANYSYVRVGASTSGAYGGGSSIPALTLGLPAASSSSSPEKGTLHLLIAGYTGTTFHHQVISKNAVRYDGNLYSEQHVVSWNVTPAAINRIQIRVDGYSSDHLLAGSHLRIFGLKS